MLLFEIRIEKHRKIADEDSAEPRGAHFFLIQQHQAVLARALQLAQLSGEMLIEVDAEVARNFIFHDNRVAEQPIDHRAPQAVLV